MTCEQAQTELAVGVLTKSDPPIWVIEHALTCPQCAAEQARLAPMASLLSTVSPEDLERTEQPDNDLLLQRLLTAAAREHRLRRRRTLLLSVVGAAAAMLVGAVAIFAVSAQFSKSPQVTTASASANGIAATANIKAADGGSDVTVSVTGVPPGTHCILRAESTTDPTQVVADWWADYEGEGTVSGTVRADPNHLTSIAILQADGPLLLRIPL